jgi:hypothetical protein
MCEYCENPMKWRIEDDGNLLVPLAKADDPTPTVPGWEPYWEDHSLAAEDCDEPAVIIKYRQPVPVFFICAYRESRCYGGPEEGGWGYNERELIGTILIVAGKRCMAERECRVLNRLARVNGINPGSYNWGTSGILFSVDRYPGEDDTSMDPRPHYC